MRTINLPLDNVGGLSDIYLIATDNIERYNRDSLGVDLTLKNYGDYIVLPYLADETYQFTERMTIEEAGPTFEVNIEGVIPTASADNDAIIREIISKQWIAVTKDNNGDRKLVGSKEVPLSFTFDYTTGKKGERNGLTFSVSSKQSHRSFPWKALLL